LFQASKTTKGISSSPSNETLAESTNSPVPEESTDVTIKADDMQETTGDTESEVGMTPVSINQKSVSFSVKAKYIQKTLYGK